MDGLTIKLLVSVIGIGVIGLCYFVWDGGRLLHRVQKDLWKSDEPKITYYSPDVIEALKRNMKLSPETIALMRMYSCDGGKD